MTSTLQWLRHSISIGIPLRHSFGFDRNMAATTLEELDLLTDTKILDYLLKNIGLTCTHFKIPEEAPRQFLLRMSNAFCDVINTFDGSKKDCIYAIKPIYVSRELNCTMSNAQLDVKKHFGSSIITIFIKYCKSCKLSCYPWFFKSYKDKKRWYYSNWNRNGIFVSTHCTAFSTDLLDRLIALKQTCHTSFIGKTQSYNLQHKYRVSGDSRAMDKRRLSEAYFKYTFILYKERYDMPLHISGGIDEALDNEFTGMYEKFRDKYTNHSCNIIGCENCLVIDGNMKAHRKICKKKVYKLWNWLNRF